MQLIDILAYLSTAWSIKKSLIFTFSIHCVQTTTLFRLLGLDTISTTIKFENHIAQVQTGEGKSLILGILSLMLALLGFKVYCCCYSKYLSQRDEQDFRYFFEQFKVEKNIIYGTFEELYEIVINKDKNIRSLGEIYFNLKQKESSPWYKWPQKQENQQQILLIDEIDYFFGENFLGKAYCPAVQIQNEQIIKLFQIIWKYREDKLTFDKFSTYPEYIELFKKIPMLEYQKQLMNQEIEEMLKDVLKMPEHKYFVYTPVEDPGKNLICYKSKDGISFNMVQGYKTGFAYIQEYEKKVITKETMEENLKLIFRLGCYPYSKLCDNYQYILGVTGTLKEQNKFELEKLKTEFKLNKFSYAPSIYGQSKFKFQKGKNIKVYNEEDEYLSAINTKIDKILQENRAILIFVENQKKLNQLETQISFNQSFQILTEQSNFKNHIICKTGTHKLITLATKIFGRGCDFIVSDPTLNELGGLHVLQTFWSEDRAEERQIQGRTARQAEKGSYNIILLKKDLEEHYGINKDTNFSDKSKIYEQLDALREEKHNTKIKSLYEQNQEIVKYYNISENLFKLLGSYDPQYPITYKKDNQQIQQYIQQLKKYEQNFSNETNAYKYYNPVMGKIGIGADIAELDEFSNPIGDKYNLGKKGAFGEFSILIGLFYEAEGYKADVPNLCVKSLKDQYNFKNITIVNNEAEFIAESPNYDELWVMSYVKMINENIRSEFVASIMKHLQKQKGLLIWADNTPFTYHANLILDNLPLGLENGKEIKIELKGNDYCNQLLSAVKPKEKPSKQQFGEHFITTGENQIHEGITICTPVVKSQTSANNFGRLDIIGYSSTNNPCIMALDGTGTLGRIVIDCGDTKLLKEHWNKTAGTVRYVQNCSIWLLWTERLNK